MLTMMSPLFWELNCMLLGVRGHVFSVFCILHAWNVADMSVMCGRRRKRVSKCLKALTQNVRLVFKHSDLETIAKEGLLCWWGPQRQLVQMTFLPVGVRRAHYLPKSDSAPSRHSARTEAPVALTVWCGQTEYEQK